MRGLLLKSNNGGLFSTTGVKRKPVDNMFSILSFPLKLFLNLYQLPLLLLSRFSRVRLCATP